MLSSTMRRSALLLALVASATAEDWPAYKKDAQRSSITSETLTFPLHPAWSHTCAQPPSPAWPDPLLEPTHLDFAYRTLLPQPVVLDFDYAPQPIIANGLVLFGSSADDTVRALDAATGEKRWRFTTSGPIRFAPTVASNKVYVASDDGHLYCLELATGALVWRFRGALTDESVVGNGRVISRWPLRSGVLVDQGVAYITAGMWPSEGIFVFALDAETGAVLWCNDTSGALNHEAVSRGAYAITGVAPQGYLLASSKELVAPTGRSVPARYSRATGDLSFFRQTGYQHYQGGSWATLNEVLGFTFFGYPTVRLMESWKASRKNISAKVAFQHKRFRREFRADRVLISTNALYRVKSGVVFREGPSAARVEVWRSEFAGGRAFSIARAGRALLVGGENALAAYDVKSGKELWRHAGVDGQVRGMAIADGRLLISTHRGQLVAFATGNSAGDSAPTERRLTGTVRPTLTVPAPEGRASPPGAPASAAAERRLTGTVRPTLIVPAPEGRASPPGEPASAAAERRLTGTVRPTLVVPAPEGRASPPGAPPSAAADQRLTGTVRPTLIVPAPEGRASPPGEPDVERLLSLIDDARITKGYGLLLGDADRNLAIALTQRTGLQIVVARDDEAATAADREHLLDQTRLYGSRIAVHRLDDAAALPYATYSCALVIVAGDPAALSGPEIYRVLRPCGGLVAFLDATEAQVRDLFAQADVPTEEIAVRHGVVSVRRGKLPGAFDWDSPEPLDGRVKWPLKLGWFGGPGPTTTTQGGPIPVAANGRFFMTGRHHVIAVDAYTGIELWTREIPHLLRRAGDLSKHSGPQRVSPMRSMAADDDHVFLNFGHAVFQLDAQTGRQVGAYGTFKAAEEFSLDEPRTFTLGEGAREKVDGFTAPAQPVGEIFDDDVDDIDLGDDLELPVGDVADVTLTRTDRGLAIDLVVHVTDLSPADSWELFFDFRPAAQRHGLYGPGIFQLVVNPRPMSWEPATGPAHPNIELQGDDNGRRIRALLPWTEIATLVDPAPASFAFGVVFNRRVLGKYARWTKFADDYAYAFNNGWAEFALEATDDAGVSAPVVIASIDELPAIAGRWGRVPPHTTSAPTSSNPERHASDKVRGAPSFKNFGAYGSAPLNRIHPLTRSETARVFRRGKGCGGRIASADMEFLRCGTIGLYDFADDSGMRYFGGLRSACYVNMLPALGVLFAGEGSSSCACSYNFKCSLALVPTTERRHEDWALFFDESRGPAFVRGAALNFGAPGDRRDRDGRLWLQHPRPSQRFALRVPFSLAPEPRVEPFRFNADRQPTAGTDRPWIYASGYRGAMRADLQLVLADHDGPMSFPTAAPPRLDGVLDDDLWDGVGRWRAAGDTYFRHDDTHLYVAHWRRAPRKVAGRDRAPRAIENVDPTIWEEEAFHLYLRDVKGPKTAICLHFAISTRGLTYDAKWTRETIKGISAGGPPLAPDVAPVEDLDLLGVDDTGVGDALDADLLYDETGAWNGPWKGAVGRDRGRLVVELAIPWKTLLDAGLRRNHLAINTGRYGKLAGSPVQVARTLVLGDDFDALAFSGLESEPRPYTVRLHFIEPDDVTPGQRVFDVHVQGKPALAGLDIAKETGGRNRALIKEIAHVPANRTLRLELASGVAAWDPRRMPVISALEVVAE